MMMNTGKKSSKVEVPAGRLLETHAKTIGSANNARKRGLRSKKFFVTPDESEAEFVSFAASMVEAYKPRDAVEKFHVDAIAIAMWRSMRADRLEAEVMSDIPPGWEGRGHGSNLVGKPENRMSLNTMVRYRSQVQMELKRAIKMLDDYRKSKPVDAKTTFCTNEIPTAEPVTPPANQNCTNETPPLEASAPPSSSTPNPTPRGEPERDASSLSEKNCTNEPPAKPRVIVHRKEPVPYHHRYWWK